ncbi:nucleotidyltransferase family protein [Undibacterium oligocarboniphilum]|uniref:Nucleotidyltransferase family protein n=1 Tax=Undibacterium oligocarboniphilum TaxID=666702 RepID=A0A850Q9H0_9BURK|nr:nucleotidyltransferase family protein [Undibacterium oligocarboniphilum]MBC3871156.1 nucleotidyltransferase family protein [Undibacterium oligocarboniphilum]NVO76221.1 nucleotidyltransferase family protein [Undibacterium oligocarboniphilum]
MPFSVPCTGILLAAGRGRRYDQSGASDKLMQLLPDGRTVVLTSALHLRSVLPEVVVVVRSGNSDLLREMAQHGFRTLVCEEADSGMAASLTCALRDTIHSTGWIIALADMPFVRPATIAALRDRLLNGADIAAPVFQRRRGNPVGFSRTHLPELLQLSGDQGARHVLSHAMVTAVDVDDAGILHDVDVPADLIFPSVKG